MEKQLAHIERGVGPVLLGPDFVGRKVELLPFLFGGLSDADVGQQFTGLLLLNQLYTHFFYLKQFLTAAASCSGVNSDTPFPFDLCCLFAILMSRMTSSSLRAQPLPIR